MLHTQTTFSLDELNSIHSASRLRFTQSSIGELATHLATFPGHSSALPSMTINKVYKETGILMSTNGANATNFDFGDILFIISKKADDTLDIVKVLLEPWFTLTCIDNCFIITDTDTLAMSHAVDVAEHGYEELDNLNKQCADMNKAMLNGEC